MSAEALPQEQQFFRRNGFAKKTKIAAFANLSFFFVPHLKKQGLQAFSLVISITTSKIRSWSSNNRLGLLI
jgi:hypothetical protein